MDVLDLALKLVSEYPFCDDCLGRNFSGLMKGINSADIGRSLKTMLALTGSHLILKGQEHEGMEVFKALARSGFGPAQNMLGGEAVKAEACFICENKLSKLNAIVEKVAEELRKYEFNSFLVGSRIPGRMCEREDVIRSRFAINAGVSIKIEVNRLLRKLVSEKIGKKVEFRDPEAITLVNLEDFSVTVLTSPVFIYGRYRKFEKGIPQNKWYCSRCYGLGCEACNWTGKLYSISIEELVAEPLRQLFDGVEAKFHGAGREDVDVRVLGNGRPFIVEVKQPKKRFLNLEGVAKKINEGAGGKIEVFNLRFSSRSEVRRLKVMAKVTEKSYVAIVRLEKPISENEVRVLEQELSGTFIRQRTPLRVLHRRADKVRVKKVHEFKVGEQNDKELKLNIRCQGGLYVKEFITGDEGRTEPSVAEKLKQKVEVVDLYVVDVKEAL
ncbi:MAG: tRNA pseudouridine(54/55) synthase Pus10 [Candidatus Nezhaarchaeales archaeon]